MKHLTTYGIKFENLNTRKLRKSQLFPYVCILIFHLCSDFFSELKSLRILVVSRY